MEVWRVCSKGFNWLIKDANTDEFNENFKGALILNTTQVAKCVCLERRRDCEYYDGHRRGDQSDRSPPPNIGDARELQNYEQTTMTPQVYLLVDFCDSLLDFISFYLVPYIMDLTLSPIGSSSTFSLLLRIFGDGRSRPRSLSMVPAPPRGLHMQYLNPHHNWLY